MKPILLALLVPALAAGVAWSLSAQDATPRVTGKVLILINERAFEGDIEKVGELYHVRKGAGEIVVAANQALRLCADWNAALAFMRSRANLDDPEERIRLAKWCQLNHRTEQALAEAKAALDMRPRHGETKQLVKVLEVTPAGKSLKPASDNSPAPVPHIDLSFESVTVFSLRIQPILMNTCVNCHSGSHRGKFRLYRLHEGGERVATHRNLAAVLSQVSLDRPAASPLLVMAVCAHGDAKTSPIPGRQSPTFQTLCTWLDQTVADNPHLRDRAVTVPATLARTPSPMPEKTQPRSLPLLPGVAAAQGAPTADGAPGPPPIAVKTRPVVPMVETPADEFSAAHFNRAFHPERK